MTVVAILKGHTDRYGKQTVFIRIHNGKERLHRATKIKLTSDDWDKDKGYVKPSHPNYKALNDSIKRTILEIEMDHITEKKKYAGADFFEYCTECFNQWDKTKRLETLRQHWGEYGKIKRFAPSLRIENINPSWLHKYAQYCYSRGNQTNTVWKTMKFIKTIVRKAILEKVIEDNPFDIFAMPKYTDPEKIFLTREQVDKIDENSIGEYLIAGTWFVIGCLTGLRFSDMQHFDKKQIKNGRLIIYTRKTGEIISLPISDRLRGLFERIGYKPLPYTNMHSNRLLKALLSECEIDEPITWHSSRHTMATTALTAGVRIEVVQKVLGHRSIKTTSIYAKLINSVIDEEMKKMG